jgi:hypothetical protein
VIKHGRFIAPPVGKTLLTTLAVPANWDGLIFAEVKG